MDELEVLAEKGSYNWDPRAKMAMTIEKLMQTKHHAYIGEINGGIISSQNLSTSL